MHAPSIDWVGSVATVEDPARFEFIFEEIPDGRMLMWRNGNYSIRGAGMQAAPSRLGDRWTGAFRVAGC